MDSSGVAPEVRDFLREYVGSYEQLEGLLLLREHPEQAWSPDVLAERLKIANASAAEALEPLAASKLLVARSSEGRILYSYGPATPELAERVALLAAAYETNRLEIVKLMSSNALERVRTSAARAFADAFLLRSGRKKDG